MLVGPCVTGFGFVIRISASCNLSRGFLMVEPVGSSPIYLDEVEERPVLTQSVLIICVIRIRLQKKHKNLGCCNESLSAWLALGAFS